MNMNPETLDAIIHGSQALGMGLGALATDKVLKISDRISSRYPTLGKTVQIIPEAFIYGSAAWEVGHLLKGLSEIIFY